MKRDYLLLALLLVGNITFAQSPIERALNVAMDGSIAFG